jgi:deoxyribonuclease-4
MPAFGAHMSVAGGLHCGIIAAGALKCDCVQIFTKSPNRWASPELKPSEIEAFSAAVRSARLTGPIVAHDAYLTNLASPDNDLWVKSIAAFTEQINRAHVLQIKFLVMHPGAHMGSGELAGIKRVAAGIDASMEMCGQKIPQILLETTAGQGTTLGWKFEHLRDIIGASKYAKNLGCCLDTCHVHAAGYALNNSTDALSLLDHFDSTIGLGTLHVLHVNDSKKPAGSRADRHEHLGRGTLSMESLGTLLSDCRLKSKSMILETPKEGADGESMDPINLAKLKQLALFPSQE